MPIIFIRHINKGFLIENSDNCQIYPSIKSSSGDLYLDKNHSGMFEEKHIKIELKKLSVKTVMVTGLITHGCVKAACLGAKGRRL